MRLALSLLMFSAICFSEPLTLEQYQALIEYNSDPSHQSYSFNPEYVGKFATGYVHNPEGAQRPPKRLGLDEKLKSWDLRNFGRSLYKILNQGNCGSCVIFSFKANIMDLFGIRNMPIHEISSQHYMNCSSGGQCRGAYGEEIADDAVRLGKSGGFYSEEVYPYTATSGICRIKNGKKEGVVLNWETIDGSDRSILSAIHQGKPVSSGVAASRQYQGYDGGLYSACDSMGINHYVVITGVNCGKSVDKNGDCVFDENGNLDKKSGATFRVRNSWGTRWGDDGWMDTLIYGKNGKRCNGIAAYRGDAQILDNGVPVPPPGPVQFTIEGDTVTLSVEVNEKAKVSVEKLKNALTEGVELIDGSIK